MSRGKSGKSILRTINPYLFIAPFFISFFVFTLYPTIQGFMMSMTKYLSIEEVINVGFDNYIKIFTDEKFLISLKNTVLLTIFGSILAIISLALLVGTMINSKKMKKFQGAMTTVLFLPNITSVVVIGIIFSYLLKTDGGVLNEILGAVGIGPFAFLKDPDWALFSMIVLVVWRHLGMNTLYILSGLQNISDDVLEAAQIDGAGKIKTFFLITLPLLKPMMEFVIFQAIVGSFSIFGEPLMLVGSGGGEDYSMLYPNVYIYDAAFTDMRFGYSAALGFTLGAIILIITMIQRKVMNRKENV